MSQASLDELLQCSVCLERYTNPKSLPCMHTFCLSCLKGIIKDAKSVDCPTCRRTHQVPEQGAAGFHDNLMAVNFLSMFQASTECSDCQKPQILAECEHCKHQVCGDCRVAHNVLQTEISILIQLIQDGLLNTTEHERNVESARRILEKSRQVETDINNAFDEAAKASSANLASRKEELLRQVQTFAKFQNAIAEGNQETVIRETRGEISACHKTDSLREVKGILAIIEASGHSENEPAFSYDLSGLLGKCRNMGLIAFGDECPAQISNEGQWKFSKNSTSVVSSGSEELGAYGGVPLSNSTQSDQLQRQKSTFPTNVDYERKSSAIWRQVIAVSPPGTGELEPTRAVYSTTEDAMYCLSEGKVFRYDAKSGAGKVTCKIFNARDIALNDSGTLFIIDDSHIVKISPELLESMKDDMYNFNLSNLPGGTNPQQICCHGKEVILLDSSKKCLLKFTEEGKFIREIKLAELDLGEDSRMCVDKDGRIYIGACVRITDRKNSEELFRDCTGEPKSVIVSWKIAVSILTWDGEHTAEVLVGGGTKEYDYDSDQNYINCHRSDCTLRHPRIVLDSIPDNDAIIHTIMNTEELVVSFCIDGDGYMCLTRRGCNAVEIVDLEGELHCTIGDSKEFQNPTGVSLLPDGRLVVCDTGNNRIQII